VLNIEIFPGEVFTEGFQTGQLGQASLLPCCICGDRFIATISPSLPKKSFRMPQVLPGPREFTSPVSRKLRFKIIDQLSGFGELPIIYQKSDAVILRVFFLRRQLGSAPGMTPAPLVPGFGPVSSPPAFSVTIKMVFRLNHLLIHCHFCLSDNFACFGVHIPHGHHIDYCF